MKKYKPLSLLNPAHAPFAPAIRGKSLPGLWPFLLLLTLASCTGCQDNGRNGSGADGVTEQPAEEPQMVVAPDFNADSAYAYIEKQVSFGPRIPGTAAHENCAYYLYSKLKSYTPDVELQTGTVKRFDGKQLNIKNIIGHFGRDMESRVLLAAHWDTREWADQEPDAAKKKNTLAGANDGGSGVAVLLEIARQLHARMPKVGVTILLVDAEDQGPPSFDDRYPELDQYCLGTQYWGKNLDQTRYLASYGIVLDMVGARGARFLMEENSLQYNSALVEKVWRTGMALGYGNYFIYNRTSGVVDDHVYITKLARIPSIDIIDKDDTRLKGFGDFWHTTADDMSIIDKNTLKAAGQTVLTVIFNEKAKGL